MNFAAIVPDGRIEVRTFTSSESRELGDWIRRRNGKMNLYFTPNPVKRPMNKSLRRLT